MLFTSAKTELITDKTTASSIAIKGKFRDNLVKSLPVEEHPFIVELTDFLSLDIICDAIVNDVTISISENADVLQSVTTSFNTGDHCILDLSGYSPGAYSIILTTPVGTYLEGDFVIE